MDGFTQSMIRKHGIIPLEELRHAAWVYAGNKQHPELLALALEVKKEGYSVEHRDTVAGIMIDYVLVDSPNEYVDKEALIAWCESHPGAAVAHSPKMFDHWARPTPFVPGTDGTYPPLTDDERLTVLGMGAAWIDYLAQNPEMWVDMPMPWMGQHNSPLREKVLSLGWTNDVLLHLAARVEMAEELKDWVGLTQYPCSLVVAMRLSKDPSIALPKGVIDVGPGHRGLVHLVHSYMHAANFDHTFDANTNPYDVELALILNECHSKPWSLLRHPNAPTIPCDENKALHQFVGLHMSLGTVETMIDAIVQGQLWGPDSQESLELPVLDAFDAGKGPL